MAVLERTLEMDGAFLSLPLQENVATPMTQILHKMVGFQASPRGIWPHQGHEMDGTFLRLNKRPGPKKVPSRHF